MKGSRISWDYPVICLQEFAPLFSFSIKWTVSYKYCKELQLADHTGSRTDLEPFCKKPFTHRPPASHNLVQFHREKTSSELFSASSGSRLG